ncbi:MAG: hypothetical protein K6E73_02790 [Bacteroidales bacterium]|nr:hypothetical protein [Bacteroidales bacterium]
MGNQIFHTDICGELMADISTSPDAQQFKYGGKELDLSNGLNLYDFEARQYDSGAPDFTSVDPCATDYPHLSPYNYCAGDPINCIDPTGCSTRVVLNNSTGCYDVIGGDLEDGDRNIYIYAYDEEGNAVNTGIVLGRTPVMTSFYNSDAKDNEPKWQGSIDVEDQSGISFLSSLMLNTPSLYDYMMNARNGYQYDFKVTNGTSMHYDETTDYYRGMPLGVGKDGVRIFASARDVGNMGAGIVSRKHYLPWFVARFGFDVYQSRKSLQYHPVMSPCGIGGYFTWNLEGISTQNAERFGYNNHIKLR